MNPLIEVALRSVAVYLFMIFAIRLFGKNQLSQLNTADVILLLLIANAVQNAMIGNETSLSSGLVAALVLFVVNFFVKKAIFKNPKLKEWVEDSPKILVKDGVLDLTVMNKCELSTDELEETIREHGVENLSHVKLAILEVDGNISVVSTDSKNTTQFSHHKRKFPRNVHKY